MARLDYHITSTKDYFDAISAKLEEIGATRIELARHAEMSEAQLSRLFKASTAQGPTLATVIRIENGLASLRKVKAKQARDASKAAAAPADATI